jgi:hypothetical protein
LATVLSPPARSTVTSMPTPSPPPDPPGLSVVPCPKQGSAMFAGYRASHASDESQLLMLALDELPEGLELFLTNSFGNLTTESSSVIQNETGSVKVRRNSYSYNMKKNKNL